MVAEGLAGGLGLGRLQHWAGRRHGVAVLEVLSQDALGVPERPLAITESRPLFTQKRRFREVGLICSISTSDGEAEPARARVPGQMLFLLWLQVSGWF